MFMAVCLIVVVGISALAVFFIAIRGAEQTLVPNLMGKDVTAALLELQEKELYPRIQLRYSQYPHDKGLILEQDPPAGTIVKAGRRIQLVVSQGVIIDRVENYRGRMVDEVRLELQMLSPSTGKTQVILKEPFMYAYDSTPAGTILQQTPEPGTALSGPLTLTFVVSRGPEELRIPLPTLVGLSLSATLEEISRSGINFVFALRPARERESPETVVSQDPPGQSLVPANTLVSLTVTVPDRVGSDEVFALFRYTIPRNPYPLPVQLESILPSGERRTLLTVTYLGGTFTVPYRLPVGSTLVLSMLNWELHRETVGSPAQGSALP
ncbi:MAG: PASTA domain-containing protein, partial [Treponema sp.]|nr:PASTA domain-containing protein [Treponema sp.]